jgi:beta-glucosidase-like glycosyl hydrolase
VQVRHPLAHFSPPPPLSYNSINGVPACANAELLDDFARARWNFSGYVVGDCGAVQGIHTGHKSAFSLHF